MSSWRVAKCITTLQHEVDQAHPNRPKQADGTIGDARHQAEKSDHNPNANGVVTAWDITTADFTIPFAESLRALGKGGDPRVKYVIYRGRIASEKENWAWRAYSGFSQHFDHIHLSVSADPAQYDRTDPWFPTDPVPPAQKEEDVVASLEEVRQVVKEELAVAVAQLHAEHVLILHGEDPNGNKRPVSLDSIARTVKVPGA